MQIDLPSTLRVTRLSKILKNLLGERGITFPLSKCRDIVSQMLGFESWNHLLLRMKPTGPHFWDEDQSREVADERFGQYVRALMEADETNDDLYDCAHEIVRRLSPTRRPLPKDHQHLMSDLPLEWKRYDIKTITDYPASSLRDFDPGKHKDFHLKRVLEYEDIRKDDEYYGGNLFYKMRDPLSHTVLIGKEHGGKMYLVGSLCFRMVAAPSNLHLMVDVLDYELVDQDDGPYIDSEFLSAVVNFILFDQFELHLDEFWKAYADPHRRLKTTFYPQLSDWPDPQTPLDLTLSLQGFHSDDLEDDDIDKLFSEYRFHIFREDERENALPDLGRHMMGRKSREPIFNALSMLSMSPKENRLTHFEVDPVRRTQRIVFQDDRGDFISARREDFRSGMARPGEAEPWDILQDAIKGGATAFLFDYCTDKPRLVVDAWFHRFIVDRKAYEVHPDRWDSNGVKVELLEWDDDVRSEQDVAMFWLQCFPDRLEKVITKRKRRKQWA